MNIKINYFLYTRNFETTVLDVITGVSYKASFAYKTPATDEIVTPFVEAHGRIGYLADEYNVYRIDETGEEFVYPYSFGYANPDDVMQSEFAKKARVVAETTRQASQVEQPAQVEKPPVGINYMLRMAESHRRHERNVMEQRFPSLKFARLLAEATGLTETSQRKLEITIAILHSEGLANPFERTVRECYHEVKALLVKTDAALVEVRSWFGKIAGLVEA